MKKFIEALVGFTSQIPSQVMDIFQQAVDYTKGLEAEIQRLRDEIARLKEVPVKPDIKPGKDKENNKDDDKPKSGDGGKVGGSKKGEERQKKKTLRSMKP